MWPGRVLRGAGILDPCDLCLAAGHGVSGPDPESRSRPEPSQLGRRTAARRRRPGSLFGRVLRPEHRGGGKG